MGNHTSHHRAGASPGVIRITRAGWFYILLTIFLGVSGINTGNNLIYLIVAAFLSFMGVSGFFGKRNISNIDVRIELPDEIYANTNVPVKITIMNKRRFLPAFLIRVYLSHNEVLFPFVDVKSNAATYLPLSFRERGHVTIGVLYLSSVFPFNFFVRYRTIPGVCDALVFPGVKKCASLGLFEREKRYRGEQVSGRSGYEADIISLRDYIEGDPLKYIHWKASAKTGRLKTKELSSLSDRPVVIDFDAIPIKDVEERISCVTYVLLKLFRQNIPVGLRISGAVHKPRKAGGEGTKALRIAMLTKLALYQRE